MPSAVDEALPGADRAQLERARVAVMESIVLSAEELAKHMVMFAGGSGPHGMIMVRVQDVDALYIKRGVLDALTAELAKLGPE